MQLTIRTLKNTQTRGTQHTHTHSEKLCFSKKLVSLLACVTNLSFPCEFGQRLQHFVCFVNDQELYIFEYFLERGLHLLASNASFHSEQLLCFKADCMLGRKENF